MVLSHRLQMMKPTNKKFLLVVAGPTASGKTSLAIQFARHFNTEIISADSRQFYRELPIGTAAPTWHEQSQATHHFVGNTSIHDTFDVASYEQNAISLLSQLFEKHNIVILCGGSGLFIDAEDEQVAKVVRFVNEKMEDIVRSSDELRILDVAILAALNITEDFLKLKGVNQDLCDHLEHRSEKLIQLIENAS